MPNPTPVKRTLVALASITALAACAPSEPLPESVCGTLGPWPVRVTDDQCYPGNATVRWYQADPVCHDADDRTEVGDLLDDDYLGESCDPPRRRGRSITAGTPPSAAAKPTTTARPAPTKATQARNAAATKKARDSQDDALAVTFAERASAAPRTALPVFPRSVGGSARP